VVWDPAVERRLTVDSLHSAVDYTMYEGKQVKGGVHTVLSRGDVIIENGMFRGAPGRGRYIMRQPASRAAASG